jgi:hypothetical protein
MTAAELPLFRLKRDAEMKASMENIKIGRQTRDGYHTGKIHHGDTEDTEVFVQRHTNQVRLTEMSRKGVLLTKSPVRDVR